MRWVLAAQHGCLMVSEPLSVPQPFEPGIQYVEAPFDELPDTIDRLLASPDDVLVMARGCAEFIQENMRAEDSVSKVVAAAFSPNAVS